MMQSTIRVTVHISFNSAPVLPPNSHILCVFCVTPPPQKKKREQTTKMRCTVLADHSHWPKVILNLSSSYFCIYDTHTLSLSIHIYIYVYILYILTYIYIYGFIVRIWSHNIGNFSGFSNTFLNQEPPTSSFRGPPIESSAASVMIPSQQ